MNYSFNFKKISNTKVCGENFCFTCKKRAVLSPGVCVGNMVCWETFTATELHRYTHRYTSRCEDNAEQMHKGS